jgi:hypothetical protein
MPPSPADRQLLIVTGGFLALAVAILVVVLMLAGGREPDPGPARPLFIGLRRELTGRIAEGGPLYFANPFAGDGFWLDLEDGHLVALAIDRPGTTDCVVKWKDPRKAYVDCNDRDLTSSDLDRYPITIGSRGDSPKGSVYVDLRELEPAAR